MANDNQNKQNRYNFKPVALCYGLFAFNLIRVKKMAEHVRTDGEKTAAATVLATPGYLHGIHVITDGTNAATMVCYDQTSATGTIKATAIVPGATSVLPLMFDPPLKMDIGAHITIAGTGASFVAYVK